MKLEEPTRAKEPITACPVCGAAFKTLRGLNRHLTKKHGVKTIENVGVLGGG